MMGRSSNAGSVTGGTAENLPVPRDAGYDLTMGPSPAVRLRRAILPLCVAVAVACRDGPSGLDQVRDVQIEAPSLQLRPGDAMQVTAIPVDERGDLVPGRVVQWRTLTPATLSVTPDGFLLGLAPGVGIVRATVGTVGSDLEITLVNPPAASVSIDSSTLALPLPAGGYRLKATPRDIDGVPIIGAAIVWRSTADRIAAVNSQGQVTAVAAGQATVSATVDGVAATTRVTVAPVFDPAAPQIGAVNATVLVPGQLVSISGANFGPGVSSNAVLVDGVPVTVTSASSTLLLVQLPAAEAFACETERTVQLQVSSANGIGAAPVTLRVQSPVALGVGQSLILGASGTARCIELADPNGRYLVTVPNAARALGVAGGSIAVSLRGSGAGANMLVAGAPALRSAAGSPPEPPRPSPWRPQTPAARREHAHHTLHEFNRAMLRAPAPAFSRAVPAPGRRDADALAPALGSIVSMRLARLGEPVGCNDYTPIGARTVFVGANIVILEDTITSLGGVPTLAGAIDFELTAIGNEIETTIWPLVRSFGDPLRMDSRLDDNDRVFVLVTPRMNQKLGGAVMAAVISCDFRSRAQFASSNVGEVVYTQAPTTLATEFVPGSRSRWLHEIRATLAHELKHVVSYAERIVLDQPVEEAWLEEATARHAEELYARAVLGTARGADEDATRIRCELRVGLAAYPECITPPRAMRPHFTGLWDFLDAPHLRSPLGPVALGAPAIDFSYYGSAWALTRWALDQASLAEAPFFTALTTSGLSGVDNLEVHTGRTWETMLPEWSLAMAVDGRIAPATASPSSRFPSWNLAAVFTAFCEELGPCAGGEELLFPRAHPLRPALQSMGSFTLDLPSIVSGGFAAVELVPSGLTLTQVLEVRGLNGAPIPATARLAIIRLQ